MKHKHLSHFLALLLTAATLFSLLALPASAAGETNGPAAASTLSAPVYPATGDFEAGIAGATGWNGTRLPLPVYDAATGGKQIAAVPASDGGTPIPFALLGYDGGERVKIGLAIGGDGSVAAWKGGKFDTTGWVNKEHIFVNLPDVLPSAAYNLTNSSGSIFQAVGEKPLPGVTGKQFYQAKKPFNARLGRYEYIVPCMFTLAERLAAVQKSAMANGETLVIYETFRPAAVQSAVRDSFAALWNSDATVSADMDKAISMGYARNQGWFIANGTSNHQAGLAVDMSLAKGDSAELHEYTLGGSTYRKYEAWTEYEMPTPMHQLSAAAIRYKSPVSSWTMPSKMDNWTEQFAASEGAKKLQRYCTDAGLIPLASEWWHFNDPAIAKIMAKGSYAGKIAVNTAGNYTFDRAYSVDPHTALTELSGVQSALKPAMTMSLGDTGIMPMSGGDTGGLNPGSAGGQKPSTSNVAWATDPERTFLRFTLLEFPGGVVTDLGSGDYSTWHVLGTPLNVVWSKGSSGTWTADECRSKIGWFNSNAMQFNAKGTNAAQLMGSTIYSYDATSGNNKRWVTTADEFQQATGITDQQKEQMFHCNSSSWSTGWLDGDYTSMWGSDPEPVTDGNLYNVYKANDAFVYLLGRLSETNGEGSGWSKDEALTKWSEFVHDGSGNLRTKYRIIIETGAIIVDPDNVRRAYTLREMMAYSLCNNEPAERNNLIWDQSSTIKNMAQWMRQSMDNQFLEYPLDESGIPTGEELHSVNGFREADSFVDSISSSRQIRDTIFSERRSYGLHILSPFNFEITIPDDPVPGDPGDPDPDPDTPGSPDTPVLTPGKAILFKRDARTNTGVGPATFKFSSVVNGDYEFTTSATGELEPIQWWDPTEQAGKYIKPGEYAVTELIPPPNYTSTSEVKQIKLELDADGDPIPAGPLVFSNLAKVGLRIVKYDRQNHSPMGGVTFEIYKDGASIGRYETNNSGEILLAGIEPGTYLAFEVDTGDDSHLLDGTYQEVELEAGDGIKDLIFYNDVKPGLKLVKVDSADPAKTIPGAVFEIKAVAGDYGPEEFTTDSSGEIDLSKLPEGAYTVTEKSCPGYLIDDAQRIIHLRANDTAELVFSNTRKPAFRLIKTSADGTPLDGVTYKITPIGDASHSIDRTTANGGEILVDGLEPGIYSVVETATLPNHIPDKTEYHVELSPGRTAELRLTNDRRPNLTIIKRDADTGEPVPGTVFEVQFADGHSIQQVTTGPDGSATLENLLPGVYEVSEKSVPNAYLLDAPSQLVTLYPNRDHTVHFQNHRKPTLTVNKVDSITGSPIKGAKFQVWYGSNNTLTGELNDLGVYYSDDNGQFVLDLLRDGWYRVTELEPAAGYTIKEPATQEFYIKAGERKTVTFENVPLNAIIVEKYDSVTHEALPGCTFQLRYLGGASGTGGTVIGQKVTGKNGTCIWTGLQPGAYIVEEVDPADGYSIINSSETVFLADNGEQSVITVRFDNAPDGILLIRKVCAVNPSVTLQNAEFKVMYADGTLIGDSNGIYRTDENGEIRIEGLKPGKSVVVTETRAPAGFILDTQSQTVQIKEGRTVSLTFKNQPKGAIIIQKRDSATGQPLAGAEFRVTTAAGCEVGLDGVIGTSTLTQNGIFTTDAQGEIKISNLAPGAYVLNEVKAPAGYVMDRASTNVVIGQGGDTQTVVITNSKAGTLVIDKRDSLTGKPLQGVTFKVTTSTGEYVPDASGHISSNGLYFTDKDGKIVINGVVGTLVVTETTTIPGYTIDEATRTQTVDVRPNDTQTLHFTNTPSTTLVIEKYIEGTTTPLKGVTFLVTDSSGAVVGRSNGEFITDENGRIVISDLTPGVTVTAREVKTLEGYVLDTTPKSILIKAGEVQTLRFYNQKQGTIVIRKLDKQTGKPLAGVEFEITYSDGSYLDDDYGHLSSKGLYKTDANGEIRISGVVGTLVITETKPLPGYVMDEGTRTQTVKVNPTDTQTITVYNTKVGGLTIIKKDEETGARIKGVQFEVRKLNGEIVGTYTTDTNGVINLPEAEKGWYQVVELKAAKGYKLDDVPRQIEVKDGQTATLEITNRQIGSAIIHKVDSLTGEGIYGVKFLISDATGHPIGTYESDNEGYVYVERELPDGKYTVRELECADGYILDTQPKTFYVEYGGCTTITWPNTAVRGQIQIVKKSADYNPTNGLPAGTLLSRAAFEIYNERTGNKVDTIVTGANGLAASKQLPLGRYTIRETKAPANYGASAETYTAVLEYSGQIVKLEITNKSLTTGVSIEKTGPKEATPGQPVRYVFSRIGNTSNVMLKSFYWRDTLPAQVRLEKVVTGTYNFPGTYKIVYKVNNTGDYLTLADSLSTSRNYTLAASPTALGLAANQRVTEIMFVFGQAPAGFSQVEAPMLYCTAVKGLAAGSSFVNVADVGGTYNGIWVQAVTRWVTTVYGKPTPLPKTGY